MSGTSTKPLKLSADTPPGLAIKDSIIAQWNQFGADISKWKTPSALYAEHAHLMDPYGDSERSRKDKHRTSYNRQTADHFVLSGKSSSCFNHFIAQ